MFVLNITLMFITLLALKISSRSFGIYVHAEFAYNMIVTEKCDAYTFGVASLETIRGKHPGDLHSSLSYLTSSGSTTLEDILDKRLPYPTDRLIEKEIVRVCNWAGPEEVLGGRLPKAQTPKSPKPFIFKLSIVTTRLFEVKVQVIVKVKGRKDC
ncbi:putative non-specific serine/threonine protein kinase [Helianthus annuus]|nr:putative non-specific serine/threonine protein kinase [Helianthus annuus]